MFICFAWILGGCIYNKHRYDEEENVRTEQPCLKCICRKGVVLCTMRVCPPVKPMTDIETDTSKCHIVRQEGTCCPTVDCITDQSNITIKEKYKLIHHFDT